jgi:hypothetical protein
MLAAVVAGSHFRPAMKATPMRRQFEPRDDSESSDSHEGGIGDDTNEDSDSELDQIDPDDERWDAFIADDDEWDPQPEHGDFWDLD